MKDFILSAIVGLSFSWAVQVLAPGLPRRRQMAGSLLVTVAVLSAALLASTNVTVRTDGAHDAPSPAASQANDLSHSSGAE